MHEILWGIVGAAPAHAWYHAPEVLLVLRMGNQVSCTKQHGFRFDFFGAWVVFDWVPPCDRVHVILYDARAAGNTHNVGNRVATKKQPQRKRLPSTESSTYRESLKRLFPGIVRICGGTIAFSCLQKEKKRNFLT